MTDDSAASAALKALIVAARTPAQYRALAAELERIALLVRSYADAAEREQRRPATRRLRSSTARGGRPAATTVYLQIRAEAGRHEPTYTIRIGRGIYDAYQATRPDPSAPLRLAPQVVGNELRLAETLDGYLVMVNVGGVRLNVNGARDASSSLPAEVRWPAVVRLGGIVAKLY
jgi:hypothetical protein